jgi:glyoxylate reductase
MGKPKVFVTRVIPSEGLDQIRAFCDATVWEDELPPPREVILRETRDADGLVSLLTDKIDGELMDACPRLRVVSNYAVGFDNLDIPAGSSRGILMGNTPGVLTETTADFAFALLMASARRIVEGADYVRADRWKTWGPLLLLGVDVHHATLGLVGLGRIGVEMAKRARGFEMRVIYYDVIRHEDFEQQYGLTYAPLEDVLAQADFVSIHTPLTPETHHLMNRERFALMKSSAILINTSRGPVVDEAALAWALKEHVLAGAALDVYEKEPEINAALMPLENVLLIPHLASATTETRTAMADLAVSNALAVLNGKPPVTPVP